MVLESRRRRASTPFAVTSSRAIRRHLIVAIAVALTSVRPTHAAPVLRSAEAVVRFADPAQCDVRLTLVVSGAADVEHRLEVLEGTEVELLGVEGATEATPVRDIGRTRALSLRPASLDVAYSIVYRVVQRPARAGRCPLWLPTAPADGRSRNVRLRVSVPDGTEAAATMPSFSWNGPTGAATLAHVPAVVIVPFVRIGDARPWDVSRVMDLTAMATLVVSTGWWLRRRRRLR